MSEFTMSAPVPTITRAREIYEIWKYTVQDNDPQYLVIPVEFDPLGRLYIYNRDGYMRRVTKTCQIHQAIEAMNNDH
jgi:hypothetical protein